MGPEKYDIHKEASKIVQAMWSPYSIEAIRSLVNRPDAENSGVIPIPKTQTIEDQNYTLQQIFIRIPGKKPELFTKDQIRFAFLDHDTSTFIVIATNQPRRRRFSWTKKNPAFYVITYLNPQTSEMVIIDDKAVKNEIY